MHVVTAMQLTGTAGDIQVKNAEIGGIYNWEGPRWPISCP
ncbi:hypothetical protein LAB1_31350 [Roseibium sp. LAB1]